MVGRGRWAAPDGRPPTRCRVAGVGLAHHIAALLQHGRCHPTLRAPLTASSDVVGEAVPEPGRPDGDMSISWWMSRAERLSDPAPPSGPKAAQPQDNDQFVALSNPYTCGGGAGGRGVAFGAFRLSECGAAPMCTAGCLCVRPATGQVRFPGAMNARGARSPDAWLWPVAPVRDQMRERPGAQGPSRASAAKGQRPVGRGRGGAAYLHRSRRQRREECATSPGPSAWCRWSCGFGGVARIEGAAPVCI